MPSIFGTDTSRSYRNWVSRRIGGKRVLDHFDLGDGGFFVLDPKLPRWKRWLAYDGVTDKNAVTI